MHKRPANNIKFEEALVLAMLAQLLWRHDFDDIIYLGIVLLLETRYYWLDIVIFTYLVIVRIEIDVVIIDV